MANNMVIAAGVALALSGAVYGQTAGSGGMGAGTMGLPGAVNPNGIFTDSAGNVISDPRGNRDGRRGPTAVDPRRVPSTGTAPLGTTGGIDSGSVTGSTIGGPATTLPGTPGVAGGIGGAPGVTGGASVGGAAGTGGVGVGAGAGGVGIGAGASGVGVGAGAGGSAGAGGPAR